MFIRFDDNDHVRVYVSSSEGHLYSYDNTVTWCDDLGGSLPTIHSKQDLDWLASSTYHQFGDGIPTWLNMKRISKGGVHKCDWNDGSPYDFPLPWETSCDDMSTCNYTDSCAAGAFNDFAKVNLFPTTHAYHRVCVRVVAQSNLVKYIDALYRKVPTLEPIRMQQIAGHLNYVWREIQDAKGDNETTKAQVLLRILHGQDKLLVYVFRGDNLATFHNTMYWCNNLGGFMPSIHSKEDIKWLGKFLNNTAGRMPRSPSVWIGMNRTLVGGKDYHCNWLDGTPYDYNLTWHVPCDVDNEWCYHHDPCCGIAMFIDVDFPRIFPRQCNLLKHQLCLLHVSVDPTWSEIEVIPHLSETLGVVNSRQMVIIAVMVIQGVTLIALTAYVVVLKRMSSKSPPPPIPPMIDNNLIELRDKIGDGHFGVVYEATLHNGYSGRTQKVAVKTLHSHIAISNRDVNMFLKESLVMKSLNHPNVLHLIGLSFQQGTPMMILPFMENGCLLNYIRDEMNVLTMAGLLNFAVQIAKGMEYLGQHQFVHRDLAARNCMLDETLLVKVGDFGLARDVYQDGVYVQQEPSKVPLKWMALESLSSNVYTAKSDVWSYGVVLWELMTRGDVPYGNLDNSLLTAILRKGKRLDKPDLCPDGMYRLMQMCWDCKPEQRPTFATIITEIGKVVLSAEEV